MKRTSGEQRTRAVNWREIKHTQPPTAAPHKLLYPNRLFRPRILVVGINKLWKDRTLLAHMQPEEGI